VRDLVDKGSLLDGVPDTEDKAPTRPQHATRLGVTGDPVGEVHRAKLPANDVERSIFERQVERVRLPPFDADIGPLPGGGAVEHRRVEVGHHAARVGLDLWCKRA
jgi:hypothetical protein